MAVYALVSEYCSVNSVDYSGDLKSATLVVDAAQLDTTDFASGGWVEYIGGLKSGTLSLEFQDDVADSALDDEWWALLGTVVAFEVRPTSASVGANNPKYTGNVLITTHSIGGSVGDLAMKSVSLPTSGAVTRAEA